LSSTLISGQPLLAATPGVLGHLSKLSAIPSPSVSGHPLNLPATVGQGSLASSTPSLS